VHNGTLHNANPIRRKLEQKGYTFDGQTDSEVLAKLIGHYYAKKSPRGIPARTLKDATEKALQGCDGTWGLVAMCSDQPDELVVACNGSPLVIGVTAKGNITYIASEVEAFQRHTQTFVALRDGEVGVVTASGPILDAGVRYEQADVSQEENDYLLDVSLTPAPYEHWTLREIYEQPEAVGRALCFGGRMGDGKVWLGGLDIHTKILSNIRHLVLTAVGTSLHAIEYGTVLLKHLGTFATVTAVDASKCEPTDFPSGNTTACCVVSQSGETRDIANILQMTQESNVPSFSIVNAVGSTVARATKLGVYCHAGRERAVVSTKSFMAEVTTLSLVGLWFQQLRGGGNSQAAEDLKEALMRLPMACGAALKTHEQCKKIAALLTSSETCFVIGKGYAEPVARQGAMKLMELGYLHAEGCGAGALKHGCLALVEPGSKKKSANSVIVVLLDDEHAQSVRNAAEEIKARGGKLIVITDKPSLAQGLDANPIAIPNNGPLTALGAVIPLQLIAYELALLR
jgi:glucosamine--fructose-6-phosphate aminotransferase (isomerizing)